jgi:uncharacterized protein (TIGR00251 family)
MFCMNILNFLMSGESVNLVVKPNSPKTLLKEFDESRSAFLMDVHAIPENNKANIEIIKYFKKNYKIDIVIISGFTSKKKRIKLVM